MNIVLIILGFVSIGYDVVLIAINPGSFLDNLFSFTHIWSALGLYLIFVGIYRIKTGHSFFGIWKKWLKITFICLVSIGCLIAVINLTMILTPDVVSENEKADFLILLGGGISKDGELPESVIKRVEKAAECLKQNPECICVVTGGTLDWLPYPEAPELKRQLVLSGVNSDKVLVEDQAKDTIQNFQLSCRMIAEFTGMGVDEVLKALVVVVTNSFHLRRSEYLASRIGFTNVKGIAAECPAIYVPHLYVREIGAYVKLCLRILLTGEPRKLES